MRLISHSPMRFIAALFAMVLFNHYFCSVKLAGQEAEPAIRFNESIRPIFRQHCTACHGGVKAAGGVSFVYRDSALGTGDSGEAVIVADDPAASELIRRLRAADEERMPPPDHGPGLSDDQIAIIETWIRQGAIWDDLWSLQPVTNPTIPKTKNTGWCTMPLDHFVLAELESHERAPSASSSTAEWLRRVTFDLIGLPPSIEEFEAFHQRALVNRDEAKREVVERLLSSPHFGERWASMWLDLARYSDTFGFEKDPGRTIWPWRDWVIRAFNDDMPYDQFSVRQIAGDLMENATADDILATAFHRNTQNNTEGGTDDEEFRVAAVVDRVDTIWTTWQSTTFGCVRCHSHPYDPYPHADYYRMLALFNNTEDCDLNDDFPVALLPEDATKRDEAVGLARSKKKIREDINALGLQVLAGDKDWSECSATQLATSHGQLTVDDTGLVHAHGTLPIGVTYTIRFPVKLTTTAIQLIIEPDNPSEDRTPERGSVLSKLTATAIQNNGQRIAVEFEDVIADYLAGPYDPRESLSDGEGGFGEFPVVTVPRSAVFVLKETLPADAVEIELEMKQAAASNSGFQASPIRAFRWRQSASELWREWLTSDKRKELNQKYDEARVSLQAIAGPRVPVLEERTLPASRRTRVFIRGNRLSPGEDVVAGIPTLFRGRDRTDSITRLEFALWLVSEKNPLAARTIANRLWAELFGLGIVETVEDMGTSGAEPSNQDLLDSLAWQLVNEHQWSIKRFLREIVLSATYDQTATAEPAERAMDTRNRWLGRGPRKRLTAEMIRDQALAVSGLLSRKQGGPPVFPLQPEGIWNSVYNGATWQTSVGEDRYRRAIYTYHKRTSGYPGYLTFDAPTRDACTARRIATNTPLQALLALNDPALLECAKGFARRVQSETQGTRQRIELAARRFTLAEPSMTLVDRLLKLYDQALLEYLQDDDVSKKLGDSAEEAALVLVANALMNLDLALNR